MTKGELEREIAEKKEEIDSTNDSIRWFAKGESYEDKKQEAIQKRILSLLETQLSELQRGMKEEPK